MYKTLYNGYSISINSNSSNQVLTFGKGGSEETKVLNFFYETPEIVFHLYKSNFDNIIVMIEGRDYYGSNLGIYYIEKNTNKIIEIDDTLTYNQDDPETNGFKFPKAEIKKKDDNLQFKIYLGNKFLYEKKYNISSIKKANLSSKNEVKELQKQTTNENRTKTVQNVFLDLDSDGHKENFEVNFNDGTIKGNKTLEREIFLDKKSLIIQKEFEENNPHDFINYKYYFSEFNNSIILEKVEFRRETYVENDGLCKINYTYLPNDKIYFSQVDFFNTKFLQSLIRDIGLKEATEITTKINQNYNCTSPLSIKELNFLLNHTVLNNTSVNNYNNLAYYLEQNKQYQTSVYLLKNIIEKYPTRIVAWLNYGDSLWGINENSQAKNAYQKYISLMKSQNKDLSKISKYVFERSK